MYFNGPPPTMMDANAGYPSQARTIVGVRKVGEYAVNLPGTVVSSRRLQRRPPPNWAELHASCGGARSSPQQVARSGRWDLPFGEYMASRAADAATHGSGTYVPRQAASMQGELATAHRLPEYGARSMCYSRQVPVHEPNAAEAKAALFCI
eukprot:TRINITY_DN13600_c0_g1_i2.p3 TRINITY_DN13600_c0_g1~~TRINITY_DN13600_c0_g1_i2.p3  ORF type:complete len:166 (-),score=33.01 TRINITY_DN13600_c0_g1_i2:606-1058(-)